MHPIDSAAVDPQPFFTVIESGEVYAPEPLGVRSILVGGGQILQLGEVDVAALDQLDLGYQRVDARGCLIIPGLIDAHAHLIGAGGEQGPKSRMPEVTLEELVRAGITTVVGCLGTDTVTRNLATLLGKVRQLDAQGLTAFLYTGGFQVPTPTLTGSVMSDLILIDKVIGVGEIAISDVRGTQPQLAELARLCADAFVGGTIGGKAGVTHFHVGPGRTRLAPLHALLTQCEIVPAAVYATHVQRTEALFDEAVKLAERGAYVDIDTIDEDLPRWLSRYLDAGGPMTQLTASSDANTRGGAAAKLHGQLVACCRQNNMSLSDVLPLFTVNPAAALKLPQKGRLREHADADLVVLTKDEMAVRHVLAKGKLMLTDGKLMQFS